MTLETAPSDQPLRDTGFQPCAGWEWECIFAVLIAVILYVPQLTRLEIRGEESRRGVVAQRAVNSTPLSEYFIV